MSCKIDDFFPENILFDRENRRENNAPAVFFLLKIIKMWLVVVFYGKTFFVSQYFHTFVAKLTTKEMKASIMNMNNNRSRKSVPDSRP